MNFFQDFCFQKMRFFEKIFSERLLGAEARKCGELFGEYIRKVFFWENVRNFFIAGFLGIFSRKKLGAEAVKCRVPFQKYKKSFLLRKCKKFFNHRIRKFHFLKYKEFFRGGFFCFIEPGLKSVPGNSKVYYCEL